MTAELLLKAVADGTRLKILSLLMEKPKFVEEIAKELDITESTASFHLKKLQAVGFVVSKKEQYYQIYSINSNALQKKLIDIVEENKTTSADTFKKQVISECFNSGDRLKSLPVQIKKREVVLSEIVKLFKPNKVYTDKQVNLIIADVYDDFILVKNEMINFGFLKRTKQGLKVCFNAYDVKRE